MTIKEMWWRTCGKFTPKEWWGVFNGSLIWEVSDGIRFNRQMRGVSQAELASRVGTEQPAIARFERGRENITVSRLRKLANAIGCVVKIQILPLEHAIKQEYEEHALPIIVSLFSDTPTQVFHWNMSTRN